jgi:putative ABC transport system permease protein
MDTVWADLRYAGRSLRKTPGFALVVVTTIAVGIGFGSANFSVVHELLVRPLDVPDLDRLAMIEQKAMGDQAFDDRLPPRAWLDLQKEARAFEALAALRPTTGSLTGAGAPEQIAIGQVSPEFFPILQTPAAIGRTFAPDEREGQNDRVVVLGDGLWRRRFGALAEVVGRSIVLDGVSHTVVGVMPRSFRFPGSDLWTPLALSPAQREDRATAALLLVGRLRAGVSMRQAEAEVAALGERHARLYPATNRGVAFRAIELARGLMEDITRAFIYTLMAASGFLLLIVCANVANLLLARGSSRRREMAVRAALGGRQRRLVRQLLTESVVLSLLAGALSLLVASWSIDFIKGSLPASATRFIPGWDNMGVNSSLLVFTLAVAVGTALVFGVAPALSLARTPIGAVLKDGGRTLVGGRRIQRLRSGLVVVQISVAVVLLVGAGVVVKAFVRAANPRRGVEPEGVLTAEIRLPRRVYQEDARILDFQRRALRALAALPGAEATTAAHNLPWGRFGSTRTLAPEGRADPRPEDRLAVDFNAITPGHPSLLRIPLRAGEALAAADDRADGRPVAVLSETAARLAWPDGNAVGRRFRLDGEGPLWTVVGVVGDVYNHYDRHPQATVYVPFAQAPERNMYLLVRTRGDPAFLGAAARRAVGDVDPDLPVGPIRPLADVLTERVAPFRLGTVMMSAFAVVALLLAGIGVYGVVAYLVAQRRTEIGIRTALGARSRQVLQLIMGKGAWLALGGVAGGVLPALAVVRLMSTTLFDLVDPDRRVIAVVAVVVAVTALAGTLIPARQATRVDPMIALRSD